MKNFILFIIGALIGASMVIGYNVYDTTVPIKNPEVTNTIKLSDLKLAIILTHIPNKEVSNRRINTEYLAHKEVYDQVDSACKYYNKIDSIFINKQIE